MLCNRMITIMTYAYSHILLRALGAFGASTGLETWSVGLRFAIVGADVPYSASGLQTFADTCFSKLKDFHQSAGTGTGAYTFLNEVTAARIGIDGKYDPDSQDTIHSVSTAVSGGGANTMPFSAASVISLRTARPRGYASNGRIYWPAGSVTLVSTSGRVNSTFTQARVNAFKTAVQAMNTAAAAYATNMRLAVMSAVGSGRTELVTSIRSDDRLDSIERRENALPVVWYSQTV